MVDNLSNNLDKTSLSNIKLIKIIIDDSLNLVNILQHKFLKYLI